jgi:hypothetical protein
MDYCTSHFNKRIHALAIEDIETYFQQERIETDQLEFKSIHSHGDLNEKFKGIQRSICAFLNSGGGLIIWGAPEGEKKPGKKEKIFKGSLTYFNEMLEKDSMISKIADTITPLPIGIRLNVLTDSSQSIIVIEVDSSEYSPHQTRDIYYMRIDGQSRPAPHHYIEALFKKVTYPRLGGYIKIENIRFTHYKENRDKKNMILTFSMFVFNQSKLQNEHELNCRILIDEGSFTGWDHYSGKNKYYPNGKEVIFSPARNILFYGEPFHESEGIDILLENMSTSQQLRIYFFFGGKTSPMMVSEYLISLKSTPLGTDNYNSMFQLINENQYLYEKKEFIGISEEEALKKILGR